MSAFIQLSGIGGEATDKKHENWVIIQTMSAPIHRSIPEGAKDQQRSRGETTLGDVVIVRELDRSSPEIQQACAVGKFFGTVTIDFCTQVGNAHETYLRYELENVILTSYNIHANEQGDPVPTEEITLSTTGAKWLYTLIDPKDGTPSKTSHGSYKPGIGGA